MPALYTDEDLEKYKTQSPFERYVARPLAGSQALVEAPERYAGGVLREGAGLAKKATDWFFGAPPKGAIETTTKGVGFYTPPTGGIPGADEITRLTHKGGTKAGKDDAINAKIAEEVNREEWALEKYGKKGTFTAADMLARYASPTGAGAETAIPGTMAPWQGQTFPKPPDVAGAIPTDIPGLSETIGKITTRLQEVHGRLSGPLRKSTRASLTAEAGQLTAALGQMYGKGPTQALEVGKLGLEQYRAGTEALVGGAQAGYYGAGAIKTMGELGKMPADIAETYARAGLYGKQAGILPKSPEEALAMKRIEGEPYAKPIDPNAVIQAVSMLGLSPEMITQLPAQVREVMQGLGAGGGAAAKPTWEQFKATASKSGSKMSEKDLKKYYDERYGK